MTDAEVIAAIRRSHLQANIAEYEGKRRCRIRWDRAWVDPGGAMFGPGPYLKVPVECYAGGNVSDTFTVRVYPPARLRRRLARLWVRI